MADSNGINASKWTKEVIRIETEVQNLEGYCSHYVEENEPFVMFEVKVWIWNESLQRAEPTDYFYCWCWDEEKLITAVKKP